MNIPCKMRPMGLKSLPAGYTRVEYLEQPYGADVRDTLAYFNLGSYTYDVEQGDSLRHETLHQIPEIPESWERMGGEGFDTSFGTLMISAVYSARGNDDNADSSALPIINNTLALYGGRVSNPENPTISPDWQKGIFIEGTSLDTNWHVLSAYIDKSIVTFRRDNESISYVPMAWPNATTDLTCFGQRRYIRPFAGRKKYFKFWMNGELKHHLVPCLDETSTPCMYDLVSKTTFYNEGTSDFLYPTETTTYALRRVLPDWGKLTGHGLRRLYHAPAGYKGELIDYALENGFKPIVEPEKPTEGYWAPVWKETAEEIVLEWIETDPPEDIPAVDA